MFDDLRGDPLLHLPPTATAPSSAGFQRRRLYVSVRTKFFIALGAGSLLVLAFYARALDRL